MFDVSKITAEITLDESGTRPDWHEEEVEKWPMTPWDVILYCDEARNAKTSLYALKFYTGSAWKEDPTVLDILGSIHSDIDDELDGTFEDWAEGLGYDTDSRKAERIFNACRNQRDDMRDLLGDDFEAFCELNPEVLENAD